MTSPDDGKPGRGSAEDDRKARLAARLRANLQRRKAQARSRREGDADARPEGLPAVGTTRDDGGTQGA